MPSDPSGPAPTCTPTNAHHFVGCSVESPFSMQVEMGDSYVASVLCFCAKWSRNDNTVLSFLQLASGLVSGSHLKGQAC